MKSIKMTFARWSHLRLFASTLLGVALLGACDGENLFDPELNPNAELQVTLNGADGGVAGDTMRFLVTGAGPNGLNRFDVAVRGAVVKDTSLIVAATGRQVSGTVKLVLPQTLIDTVLYVSARGYDLNGNVSKTVSDTFVVFEPPSIVSMSGGELLNAGMDATLRLRAIGKRPITQLTVVKTGAIPFSNESVVVNALDITRDFHVVIPNEPADTLLHVKATARDVNGLESTREYTLPIQVTPPEITSLIAPGSATPGGSLVIQVSGKAMRGVDSLKVVLSEGLTGSKTQTFGGLKTASYKFTFPLPPNLTGSTIAVDAYAYDKAGPSEAVSWTVVLATGNPVVDSMQIAPSVPAGGRLDVRAFSSGPRPLASVTVRLRGSIFKEVTAAINGSMTSATSDLFIPISTGDVITDPSTWVCGSTTCSTTFTVDVMVTDQAGLPSYWSSPVTVTVTNLPKPPDPT